MQNLKENFLYELTKELILNSAPAYIRDKKLEIEEKEVKIKDEIEKKLEQENTNVAQNVNIAKYQKNYNPKQTINSTIKKQIPLNKMQYPQYQSFQASREELKEVEGLYFGKIQGMISDPNVISIECPGSNKVIIINTLTKTIPTTIMLNQDEINMIIESFSKESRIPRIGGVFRAIVNNLIITAIDSEYGGPKFIISKIRGRPSQFF